MPDPVEIKIANSKQTLAGLKKETQIKSRILSDVLKQTERLKLDCQTAENQKKEVLEKIKGAEKEWGSRLLSLEKRELLISEKENAFLQGRESREKEIVALVGKKESLDKEISVLNNIITGLEKDISEIKNELKRVLEERGSVKTVLENQIMNLRKVLNEIESKKNIVEQDFYKTIDELKRELDMLHKTKQDFIHELDTREIKLREDNVRLRNFEKTLNVRDKDLRIYIKRFESKWKQLFPDTRMKL